MCTDARVTTVPVAAETELLGKVTYMARKGQRHPLDASTTLLHKEQRNAKSSHR